MGCAGGKCLWGPPRAADSRREGSGRARTRLAPCCCPFLGCPAPSPRTGTSGQPAGVGLCAWNLPRILQCSSLLSISRLLLVRYSPPCSPSTYLSAHSPTNSIFGVCELFSNASCSRNYFVMFLQVSKPWVSASPSARWGSDATNAPLLVLSSVNLGGHPQWYTKTSPCSHFLACRLRSEFSGRPLLLCHYRLM